MTLTQLIMATYEMMGHTISDMTAALMVEELKAYPEEAVRAALKRCQHEVRHKLALTDIIDRIPDGHPGVEEAWAILATSLNDEAASIMWTEEIRLASGAAFAVRENLIQARLAFQEKYKQLLADTRLRRRKPVWSLSMGYDKAGRADAVRDAIHRGRITEAEGLRLIPPEDLSPEESIRLLEQLGGPPARGDHD